MAAAPIIDLPTQKQRILSEYAARGKDFNWRSKPYKSTYQWTATVVATASAASDMAIFRASNTNSFDYFSYKVGDPIPWGPPPGQRTALRSDTNQASQGRRTNGAEDFCIEGLSSTARSIHGAYTAGTYTGTDPDVTSLFVGQAVAKDPAGLYFPPQWGSPLNLEAIAYQAIAPHISVQMVFDSDETNLVGTLDEFPEGAAKSFLLSAGEPIVFNRFRIPEGVLWRKNGSSSGADLVVSCRLEEPVLVPLTLINLANNTVTAALPTFLFVDVTLRMHGTSLFYASGN
jgi:hypothetical protein